MDEYQVMLFDFMNSLPLAARVQNAPAFKKAKNVLFKITMDSKEGTLTVASILRAVFVGAYNKAVEGSNVKASSIEETPSKERPVPFNNWLEGLGALLKVSTWFSLFNILLHPVQYILLLFNKEILF